MVGSFWAKLVPTVIALAVYFCMLDAILITQSSYYNYINARKNKVSSEGDEAGRTDDPTQPLLRRRTNSNDNIGLPGSRRRSSATYGQPDTLLSPGLPTIVEEPGNFKVWLTNIALILVVCVLGTAGWFVAWKAGLWVPTLEDSIEETHRPIGAEILGYISAVFYLGYARNDGSTKKLY